MSNSSSPAMSMEALKSFLGSEPALGALGELGKAVTIVLRDEKAALGADLLNKDMIPAFESGKSGLSKIGNAGKSAFSFAKSLADASKEEGLRSVARAVGNTIATNANELTATVSEKASLLKEAIPAAKRQFGGFLDQIQHDYGRLETNEDRARYISKLCLYAGVFVAGLYAGHELPDSDLTLWGAGAHRSFLSHSAVPLLAASAGVKVLGRILERAEAHLEPGSEAIKLSHTIRTVTKVFTGGLGAGMAVHLVVDGLVQTGGTIRIHDLEGNVIASLVPGTRIDDMAYTTAMGFFSGATAADQARKSG